MRLSKNSIEYTIRQKWCGSVIYVRTTFSADDRNPTAESTMYYWGNWKKADDSQRNAALIKLLELNNADCKHNSSKTLSR